MSYQQYKTCLHINEWAKWMGIHLTHFNQLKGPDAPALATSGNGCNKVWTQIDRLSVEEAIARDESMFTEITGIFPTPKYILNDSVSISSRTPRS